MNVKELIERVVEGADPRTLLAESARIKQRAANRKDASDWDEMPTVVFNIVGLNLPQTLDFAYFDSTKSLSYFFIPSMISGESKSKVRDAAAAETLIKKFLDVLEKNRAKIKDAHASSEEEGEDVLVSILQTIPGYHHNL